jgi:hypothetical protein
MSKELVVPAAWWLEKKRVGETDIRYTVEFFAEGFSSRRMMQGRS